jgi:hypothetical protein
VAYKMRPSTGQEDGVVEEEVVFEPWDIDIITI